MSFLTYLLVSHKYETCVRITQVITFLSMHQFGVELSSVSYAFKGKVYVRTHVCVLHVCVQTRVTAICMSRPIVSGANVLALRVCVPATADFFDCRYGCHARNITRMNFAMLIARHLSVGRRRRRRDLAMPSRCSLHRPPIIKI